MKKILFAIILAAMFVGCATLPNMAFCVKETCIATTGAGAEVIHEGKRYACSFDTADAKDKIIKIDMDLLKQTGLMYVIVDGKKIGCEIQ
jgi:hypothetical protein